MGRSPPLPHHPQCRRQRGTAGAQYAGSSGLINIKRDDALLHYLTGHYQLQSIGGADLSVRRAGIPRLIDTLGGSRNSHYVNRVADALPKTTRSSIGVSAASCDATLSGIWCRFHMCRPIALKAASSK